MKKVIDNKTNNPNLQDRPSALELAYKTYGQRGPSIIILHGLFGSGRNWTNIAKKLEDKAQVFVLDLRNHGNSPWKSLMTYEEMAMDVQHFIEKKNISLPFIVGHSMGGKVAMKLALTSPKIIKGLIIVDISPDTYQDNFKNQLDSMQNINLSVQTQRSEIESHLKNEINDLSLTRFLMTNLRRDNRKFIWGINLNSISANMSAISGFETTDEDLFSGPTMFIAGKNSSYIEHRHRAKILKLFPTAHIIKIKNASHWVHADQPEVFAQTVTEFVESIG